MFKFLKNNDSKDYSKKNEELLTKTASLLIHAAKIDENYTLKEKDIIKKTLQELGSKEENLDKILVTAEKIESDSNQILSFTKKIKNLDENIKIKVIESFLKIIYSDGKSDIYEANLTRRLSGLLYLDDKLVGSLKDKVISNLKK